MSAPATGGRPRTIAAASAQHAEIRPDHIAIACEGRTVTYRELHQRSNRTAHALLAAGAAQGTRIGYLGHDGEHLYDLLLACAKTGAVLVPADPRLTPGEIEHVLHDAQAELLFTEERHLLAIEGIRPALDRLRQVIQLTQTEQAEGFLAWTAGHPYTAPTTSAGPRHPLAQMYTSGTTGVPKGVVLSQASFWAINDLLARHELDWLDWREDDHSLSLLPGHHIGGPWWFLHGYRAGATNVLVPGFDAKRTMELIRDGGLTTALMVPSMLQILLSEPDVEPSDFAGLRKVVYGGSPISESVLQRCIEVMGCEFAQIYGLTETCASAVCLPPADHYPGSPRLGAAGRPYPGVAVQAVDENGAVLPPGGIGELRIDTPAAMESYWQRPQETSRTLADGWLYTGDAGYVDADGYVYVCDRIKDVILVAGENVYPAEVENALSKHPAVADVAVTGVPHQVRGEAVHACVVAGPGERPSPRALLLFLKDRLADYKMPTSYEFVDELPRNAGGKILRRALRDRA
ncbi:long-chain-fatty-acid--CoA ligase [Streptomyces zagrosensis]|uniref:Long-chain acyl-CoA synthetase n=1 Tax=Streptomyces zagrosensis TaxID=1042984 RepID=A0A7W9QB62_9ACTN|nr:long-chain-fatty-acid--CoA ligase [Streptomyces zagrosensis]MBB5937028.1 long-chain acyl-CoA synthetase [Streptomyces zagrosensis]